MYKQPVRSIGYTQKIVRRPNVATPEPATSTSADTMNGIFGLQQIQQLMKELQGMRDESQKTIEDHISTHTKKMDELTKRIVEATQNFQRERRLAKGDKGDMPIPGVHFPIPKDGETPSPEDIAPHVVPLVMAKIKIPKDGKNGVNGIGRPGRNGKHADPQAVVDIIKEKKLIKAEHIDGWDASIEATVDTYNMKKGIKPYIHGGGDTVAAGTGITITNVNGNKVITNNNTGGFTTLTATETPSTVTPVYVFTFPAATSQPSFIITDNVWQRATTKSGTVNWTWNTGLKQATFTIPPQDEILGIV